MKIEYFRLTFSELIKACNPPYLSSLRTVYHKIYSVIEVIAELATP